MLVSFATLYTAAALVLALGVAVIPMAARRAGYLAWSAHALLTVLMVLVLATLVHLAAYRTIVPWWRIAAFYVALIGLPIIATGCLARLAVRYRPAQPWITSSILVGGMLLLIVLGAHRAGRHVFPAVITAVQ